MYFDAEETQGKVMAIMDLVMKSKLDINWAAMKWSIDSFVESVGAFQDAEKIAGGMNGVPLVYFSQIWQSK